MAIVYSVLMTVGLLSILSDCSRISIDYPDETEGRFYLYTQTGNGSGTKTLFNPSDRTVEWSDDDRLSVLAKSGQSDAWAYYEFMKDDGYDRFYCDDFKPVPGERYEYYILYPSDEDFTSVDGEGKGNSPIRIGGKIQNGTGNASHIESPLYGYVASTSVNRIQVTMKHAVSLFEVSLRNNTGTDAVVSSLELASSSGARLTGEFYLNLRTGELTSAPTDMSIEPPLQIENGTIRSGETGKFYFECAPFSLGPDDNLTLTVKCSGFSYEFPCEIPDGGCAIEAGKINSISRELEEIYYTEVTSEPADWEGDYIITYRGDNELMVLDGFQDKYGTGADITDELTEKGIPAETGDRYKAEIRRSGNGYTICIANVGYIGYSGGSNSLSRTESGTPDESSDIWKISFGGGLSPLSIKMECQRTALRMLQDIIR